MRAPLATFLAALVAVPLVAVLAGIAAGESDESTLSEDEMKMARGHLAWRRAVWRVSREDYQRAILELEKPGGAPSGEAGFTKHYLLGMSLMRLGRTAQAREQIAKAQSIARAHSRTMVFPGFLLTEALEADNDLVADEPKRSTEDYNKRTEEVIVKFNDYVDTVGRYPRDAPFSAELRFLGHVFRARTLARVQRYLLDAVRDLNAAVALAKEQGERPAAEVVSVLAQVHQKLDELARAKDVVAEARRRDPAEASHYYNTGVLRMIEHQTKDARKWLEAALARRPDFAEAHIKLARVAMTEEDPAAMRPHLEAFAALQRRRELAGMPRNDNVWADLAAGFGSYWFLVGQERAGRGDDVGKEAAYEEAKRHFYEAIKLQPGCVSAIHKLIQVGRISGMSEAEIELWKRRLEELKKLEDRTLDLYRSTFC